MRNLNRRLDKIAARVASKTAIQVYLVRLVMGLRRRCHRMVAIENQADYNVGRSRRTELAGKLK
jgi:hypothetical protein